MTKRDRAILKHVGLYRMSLRVVLERNFFGGKSCHNVVQRLMKQRYLQSVRPRGLNFSYYQLTTRATAMLGLPSYRAGLIGTQALQTHLGTLWFCMMGKAKRHRLEETALERLFGEDYPDGPHCAEEAERVCLYHAYAPGHSVEVENVIRQIRERLEATLARPKVRPWIETRQYGFVVLVDTDDRRGTLREALRRATFEGDNISTRAYIRLELAPSPRTLTEAIHDIRT